MTYYAHAIDLAFAITVWKCQGGTFDYIIALLEHTPGSPTLTFEKLYVMFTQMKVACQFQCLPLSPAFNKAKLYHLHPKIIATKWRMDIDENGYWKPHVFNSPALSVPKTSKAAAAWKKKKLMFPLTNLSLKIFPNGTAFDVIFVDSPIFNISIVNGVLNMIWWKYSITTTYSNKGSIDTTKLPQRIISQWKGILGFIVNYHPPPNNNIMMITSMCSHH